MKELRDLTQEEVEQLYDNNTGFQEIILNLNIESTNCYCEDVLKNIPREANYEVGYCGVWMNFNQVYYRDAADYFTEIQDDYCVFPDDFDLKGKLEKFLKYSEILEDAEHLSNYTVRIKTKDADYMEVTAKEILEEIVTELIKFFRMMYDFSEDELKYLAYSQYIDAGCLDGYYLDDDGRLYERRPDKLIR